MKNLVFKYVINLQVLKGYGVSAPYEPENTQIILNISLKVWLINAEDFIRENIA